MIYKINNDYYIYRDRKYIKITAKLEGEEVLLIPDTNKFIEDNGIYAKETTIDEIKKELQNKEKQKVNDDKEIIKTRYRYNRDR